MTPQTKRSLIRVGALFAFGFVLVWLMQALESVTTLLMVSFFLAYILNPAVNWLQAHKIPRGLATVLLMAIFFLAVFLLLIFIIPSIVEEIRAFAVVVPKYVSVLLERLNEARTKLNLPLPETSDDIASIVLDRWRQFLANLPKLANLLTPLLSTIFKSTLGLISYLLYAALIPILVYYMLASFDSTVRNFKELIPPYLRDQVLERLLEIDRALAGFVRGQVLICLILAGLYSLGFVIIGIDLAIVLGVTGGLLFIIPYVGTMVAVVGGSIMAFAKFGDILHVVYVIGWIGLVQLVEGYVLTPKIVGEAVGLPPVLYIVALLIGGHLFGFVGMLVAIPVAAVTKVLLVSAVRAYKASDLYEQRDLEH
ncbi:MAG: AI-2E family transporter [Thermodesulfobacteriota bacterium]